MLYQLQLKHWKIMPRQKVTDPEQIEALDHLTDIDHFEYISDIPESAFDESLRELQDVINFIFSKVSPDWLAIECNRNNIFITDKKRGAEYIFSKWSTTPTKAPDSVTKAKDEFELQRIYAQKQRELSKPKVFRGQWYFHPELEYHRYNLDFVEGGSVHCGLNSGEDNVPYISDYGGDSQKNWLIGRGEFIFSRPAVAMMHPNFDLEKGTEILSIIHDHYRLKAREKVYMK